jgi:hypothetical protein
MTLRVTVLPFTGLTRVAGAVSAGYSSVEMREGELRSEINAALSKVRAYARDMEVRGLCTIA